MPRVDCHHARAELFESIAWQVRKGHQLIVLSPLYIRIEYIALREGIQVQSCFLHVIIKVGYAP